MAKVIRAFLDLQDNEYLYDVGDEYPREGLEPSPERIKELQGSDNKIGEPLIEKPKKPAPKRKAPAKKK